MIICFLAFLYINSNNEAPCPSILIIKIYSITLVCLMKELHIFIEVYPSISLYCVLDIECISWLKKYRGIINELAIQNGVNPDNIFVDLRLDLVWYIIVYRIFHILGQNIFEAFLIEHVIIKDFYHDIQKSFKFIRVETYLEYSVTWLLWVLCLTCWGFPAWTIPSFSIILLNILVLKDEIQYLLNYR